MDNTNINTNVAQIILPPDMELRKIKKPKKKSSVNKKNAIKELKEVLKKYDTALEIAASKNISIPAQLGILPNNIADINSVKELKELSATLQSRTQQIDTLIAQGAQQQRTAGLFNERPSGGIPAAPTRFITPQRQPEILPQQPILPSPAPPIVPSGTGGIDPTQVKDSDAEKTLEQLRQEILDKLSPEDRAKAEAELEKEKQEQPATPQDPSIPEEPTTPSGTTEPQAPTTPVLETDLGFDIGGGKRIDLKSPAGFTDIYSQYRQYVEGITKNVIKMDKGIFELPKFEEQQLNETRNDILTQHDRWIKSLTQEQRAFMDSDMNLRQLDAGMIKELTLDPKDLIKEIAKAQNIPLEQITSGITKTEEKTKKDAAAIEFLTKIKQANTELIQLINVANSAEGVNRKEKIQIQAIKIQNIFQNIQKEYEKLSGSEMVSVENEYQTFRKNTLNLIGNMQRLRNDENIKLDEDGNVIRQERKPAPDVDAAPEDEPFVPPIPAGEPGGAREVGTKLRTGKFLKVKVPNKVKGAVALLDELVDAPSKQFTTKRYNAIIDVMESDKLRPLLNINSLRTKFNDLPPEGAVQERKKAAIDLIKTEILDKVLEGTMRAQEGPERVEITPMEEQPVEMF